MPLILRANPYDTLHRRQVDAFVADTAVVPSPPSPDPDDGLDTFNQPVIATPYESIWIRWTGAGGAAADTLSCNIWTLSRQITAPTGLGVWSKANNAIVTIIKNTWQLVSVYGADRVWVERTAMAGATTNVTVRVVGAQLRQV